MFEKIIAVLRGAAVVILNNLWLILWSLLYMLAGPLFMLGGTGLPILYWVARGRYFEPDLLWKSPLSFLLGHWQLILYSMAGCLVGFTLFLVVMMFYQAALTGAVSRAAAGGAAAVVKLPSAVFWEEGRKRLKASLATATLASILPLIPSIFLIILAAFFVTSLSSMFISGNLSISPLLIFLGVSGAFFLLLTVIAGWIALFWYRLALCAVCVEELEPGRAMRRSLSFFSENWPLVLALIAVSIVLSVASWSFSAPLGLIGGSSRLAGLPGVLLLKLMALPVSMLIGMLLDLWMQAALVVLFIENR